jgi:hypothetical protein
MKKLLLFCFCICSASHIKAQKVVKKDIDVLYQKYKNTDSVTIQNASIKLNLSIDRKLNAKGLPISLILSSYVDIYEKSAVQHILDNLEQAKEKAGYKLIGSSIVSFYKGETIMVWVYQKGTQYAKYGINDNEYNSQSTYSPNENERKENERIAKLKEMKGDFIYMEVGDFSRATTETSTPFKF